MSSFFSETFSTHIVPNGLLVHLLLGGNHLEGALGANLDAVGAAHAVERGHGHGELHALGLGAHGVERAGSLGRGGSLVLGHRERTDGGMRAHVGALVALDALRLVPVGNDHGDAALLVCGAPSSNWPSARSTKAETGRLSPSMRSMGSSRFLTCLAIADLVSSESSTGAHPRR